MADIRRSKNLMAPTPAPATATAEITIRYPWSQTGAAPSVEVRLPKSHQAARVLDERVQAAVSYYESTQSKWVPSAPDTSAQSALRKMRWCVEVGKPYPTIMKFGLRHQTRPIRTEVGETIEGKVKAYRALLGNDELLMGWLDATEKEMSEKKLAPTRSDPSKPGTASTSIPPPK